jgi:rhodanese-related sulfurtransferase
MLPDSSPTSSTHKPAIIIDVREPAELTATGIIPGAIAIPLTSQPDAYFLPPEEFETRFGFAKPGEADGQQTRDIVFYCRAGVRARSAAQLAVQAGYDPTRISVYEGSWLDWSDRGGRVQKWEGNGDQS